MGQDTFIIVPGGKDSAEGPTQPLKIIYNSYGFSRVEEITDFDVENYVNTATYLYEMAKDFLSKMHNYHISTARVIEESQKSAFTLL